MLCTFWEKVNKKSTYSEKVSNCEDLSIFRCFNSALIKYSHESYKFNSDIILLGTTYLLCFR